MSGLSKKPSAIFVDSEAPVLRAMNRTLRRLRHDWDLFFFEDADEAAREIENISPWIVLADASSLRTNDHLLDALNSNASEALRVMVAAFTDENVLMSGARSAHFMLAKPYEPELIFHVFDTAKSLHELGMSDDLRGCMGTLKGLPVLPDYYYKISKELEKEEPSVHLVADIIHDQPSILAKLLQIANSAFFGYPRPATTASEVVMRLGLEMIKSLVLFSGLFEADEDAEDAEHLSKLAGDALSICDDIGRLSDDLWVSKTVRGQLLLSGLVHNIGKIVNLRCRCVDKQDAECLSSEYEVAGAFLLCLWGFDFTLVSAVKHQNSESLPEEASLVEQVLNAARLLKSTDSELLEEQLSSRFSNENLRTAVAALSRAR